jgi:hypothetical protein
LGARQFAAGSRLGESFALDERRRAKVLLGSSTIVVGYGMNVKAKEPMRRVGGLQTVCAYE